MKIKNVMKDTTSPRLLKKTNNVPKFFTFISAFALLLLLGCTIPPRTDSSIEKFQSFYTQTHWYFANPIGIPNKLSGWEIKRINSMQIHLMSPRGVLIYYEEYLPTLTELKKFQGYGNLKKIPGMNKPIFEIEHDAVNAREDSFFSTHMFLLGFVGNRVFKIIAKYETDKKQVSFNDVVLLAEGVYNEIVKLQ